MFYPLPVFWGTVMTSRPDQVVGQAIDERKSITKVVVMNGELGWDLYASAPRMLGCTIQSSSKARGWRSFPT